MICLMRVQYITVGSCRSCEVAVFAMLESVAPPSIRNPVIQVNGDMIYADEVRARMSRMRAQASPPAAS